MFDSKENEAEPKTQKSFLPEKATFACSFCPYSSDWRSNLRMHVTRVHKKSIGLLECCFISFPDKKALRDHVAVCHIQRFICKTCDSCFTQSTSLKRHVAKRSCFKNFSCSFCEYTTTRKDDWDQHIQLHKKEEDKSECSSTLSAPADSAQQNSSPLNVQLKETSFTCPNCPFETKWEQSLRRHKRTHHGITMESCWSNFSGKKSCRKRRAPNHRLRIGDCGFQCATCNKVFNSADLLRCHQPVHSGQKPFKCNLCDYASSRSGSLNHHKALKHKEDNQPTALRLSNQLILPDSLPNEDSQTNEEDVEVQRVPSLRSSFKPVVDKIVLEWDHKQIMGNEYEICGVKHEEVEQSKGPFFQSPSDPPIDSLDGETDELDSVMIESKLPDVDVKIQKSSAQEACIFNCPLCPFNTKWLSALKRHLKIHEKQGIFSPTPSSSSMQYNSCSSSEPPLKKSVMLNCSLCPYSTKWSTNFKMHVDRTHKKNRCKCTTCGRICRNMFLLQRHQKNHLVVKKFTCSICNYASSQKGHVEKHMKTHKPGDDFQSTSLSIGQPAECDTSLEVRRLRSSRAIASEREENRSSRNDSIENGRRGVKRKRNSIDPVTMNVRTEEMARGYEQKDKQPEEIQKAELSISESDRSVLPPTPRQLRRSRRFAVEPAVSLPSKDSCGNLIPLPMSMIDSIYGEARLLRSQVSLVQTVPSLLPLLLRLLELSSSTTSQIRVILELEVRYRAIECFEYVWNASKMAIIRWDHLKVAMNRDTLLNAIRYAFGTLPVFINWEKNEHLEMLESVILLCSNTVKNWKQPSA